MYLLVQCLSHGWAPPVDLSTTAGSSFWTPFRGNDATSDLASGPVLAGGPTEKPTTPTLNYIVSEFRGRLGCSDAYLAGYLSVFFAEKPVSVLDKMNSALVSLGSACDLVWSVGDRDMSEKINEIAVELEAEIEGEITGVFPVFE